MNTKNIQSGIEYFLSWQWVKKFLYWLVVSAGTVSECVFLIASLWISINSTVHALVLKMVSEATSETLSQLSVASFTSLPEIIVGLAFVTTYGHIKNFCLHRKRSSLTWGILFGTPTLVFMGLSLWTLGASSLHIGYEMPPFVVATRALAGYLYGFLSMLFVLIGEPDYADLVNGLKGDVARLKAENDTLKVNFAHELNQVRQQSKATLEEKQNELLQFQNLLKTQNVQVLKLAERASSLELQDLQNYPKVVEELTSIGAKTVLYDDIARITGHSKQRIAKAKLQRHSRNKSLVMVSSLVEWLKTAPLPEKTMPIDSQTNERDTDALNLPVFTLIAEE